MGLKDVTVQVPAMNLTTMLAARNKPQCWERQKTKMKITNISSISQDHVSKLSETAEPSTLQRLEGLEIEQRSKKEHFEKLVKYCESCLQGLKDDLDEHVSELRSEVATATGRSSEVEGGLNLSALSERMDQLWSKCTECREME